MNQLKKQLIQIYVLGLCTSTSILSCKYYTTLSKDVQMIYPWSIGIDAYSRAFTHSLLWPYHLPSVYRSVKNAYDMEKKHIQEVENEMKKNK